MRSGTRIAVSVLGIYAGLLGVIHGTFEVLQGNAAPPGIVISAIGPPCQPEAVSHACWPAMTLLPSFQVSGIFAILLSGVALIWATLWIGRTNGRLVLGLLAVGMLLVGGGFLPPFYALIAAVAGTQIGAPFAGWRARIPARVRRFLIALWPWALILYLAWAAIQLVFGEALNGFLLGTGGLLFPVEIGLLLVSVAAAVAHDLQRQV